MSELDSTASTAILAAGAVYVQLMPSLSDVRRATLGGELAADVRNGLMMGSILLVGVGAMISTHERNPRALYLLTGAAVLLAGIYEGTLRRPGADKTPTAEPGPRGIGRYGM